MAGELGKDVPFHLSRYFPRYKRTDPSTPEEELERLADIASSRLTHVYVGNTVSNARNDTFCPRCRTIVTRRNGYNTVTMNLDKEGNCISCGTKVYKYFSPSSL
jgi:pyruvate formate lyase activating enzyme